MKSGWRNIRGALMTGHWSADIVWLLLVSTGVSKGCAMVSDTVYRKIVAICGIFLILLRVST
ncbi:MAG: hypothetical protein LUQ36_01385 [Methanoregula sp.]|nr:hypothetical protein [Methanoregula sp.]